MIALRRLACLSPALLALLSACSTPASSTDTCLSGTLISKGSGEKAQLHLIADRQLYALDFLGSAASLEDHAKEHLLDKRVRACGQLRVEPQPLPSRIRISTLNP